jgi:5-methyltetrahydropteroyltriglutamate--homocysteine methyltransferase
MVPEVSAVLRADHIGSLLRPPEIIEARGRETPEAELHAIEDRHILRLLEKQREAGCAIFTDGELRRRIFSGILADAVEGFSATEGNRRQWSGGDQSIGVANAVVGRLHQRRPLTSHELPFLQQHSPGPIKITLPSPNQFPASSYKHGISDKAYPTRSELLRDIVTIVAAEVKRLAEEGVAYIQIDAPRYAYYLDPKWREWLRTEMAAEPDDLLDEAIAADNEVVRAGRRAGVTLGIHLCRGNNRSNWHSEGAYDPIAEKLFNRLEADRFLLEYDDERSGGFEPLRLVPREKIVVLGLVSTKTAGLERADEVRARIDEAARYLPLDQLALSPQCGFASIMEGNKLSEDAQWSKLRLVNEVAAAVW